MKLNQSPSFRVEDFPSEQSWIGRLFGQINPFISAVNQTFDSNIDFDTNIKSVTRDYTISVFQPFDLQWPYKDTTPKEVSIVKASKGTQLIPTILLLSWSYNAAESVINISKILEISETGISTLSGRYTFTLRAVI